jgi:hypothetical protein
MITGGVIILAVILDSYRAKIADRAQQTLVPDSLAIARKNRVSHEYLHEARPELLSHVAEGGTPLRGLVREDLA